MVSFPVTCSVIVLRTCGPSVITELLIKKALSAFLRSNVRFAFIHFKS